MPERIHFYCHTRLLVDLQYEIQIDHKNVDLVTATVHWKGVFVSYLNHALDPHQF